MLRKGALNLEPRHIGILGVVAAVMVVIGLSYYYTGFTGYITYPEPTPEGCYVAGFSVPESFCEIDTDEDGVGDIEGDGDNCPNTANANQIDYDEDMVGDACDYDPYTNHAAMGQDDDVDGVPNDVDNCPTIYNPLQEDTNINGVGDKCDKTPYSR